MELIKSTRKLVCQGCHTIKPIGSPLINVGVGTCLSWVLCENCTCHAFGLMAERDTASEPVPVPVPVPVIVRAIASQGKVQAITNQSIETVWDIDNA